MTAQFHYIFACERMWRFEIGDERLVQNLSALWVKYVLERDMIRRRREILFLDQSARDKERCGAAQAYDADAATALRGGESDDCVGVNRHCSEKLLREGSKSAIYVLEEFQGFGGK